MVLQNDIDLLNPPAELEKRKHKLKRLVQSPNSFFMVKSLPIHFSRMSSVKAALTLQRCSATLRPLWCVETARLCFAHPPEERQCSLKDALSEKRETEEEDDSIHLPTKFLFVYYEFWLIFELVTFFVDYEWLCSFHVLFRGNAERALLLVII
ncbi:hypothetical protein ISN44_As09g031700 [Arabidopsis suecica]|uniref:Uncharacterized protein n=1 Tax=Arabidopsis suecica TaxID=45249 RepID=A0A8T2AQW8_ARASU|nr:hypothetical protein ISN44_As09g031700 [Arabidopsis suecica]